MRVLLISLFALSLAGSAHAATTPKKKQRAVEVEQSDDTVSTSRSSSRNSAMPFGGKVEVEPDFGFAMINPSDVNDVIHNTNSQIQKAQKSFNAEDIGTSSYYGLAATYRVLPGLGLGLGFHHIGGSSEANAKLGDNNLDAKFDVGANLVTAESRITVYGNPHHGPEVLLSPFLGLGFYSANTSLSGSALDKPRSENSSATGIVIGTSASLRYWLLPNLAGGLTTGYRIAKSGALTVKDQQNTTDSVGSQVDNNGKKVQVDAGSFMIGANLTWAI